MQSREYRSETGRVGNVRELKSGTNKDRDTEWHILPFSVARSFSYKDGDEWVNQESEWIDVIVRGKDALTLSKNLRKGMIVTVSGRVEKARNFEYKGEEREGNLQIAADSVALELTAMEYDGLDDVPVTYKEKDDASGGSKKSKSRKSSSKSDMPDDDDSEDTKSSKSPTKKKGAKNYSALPDDDDDFDNPFGE